MTTRQHTSSFNQGAGSSPSLLARMLSGGIRQAEHKAATPAWYSGLQAYVQPPATAVWSARSYQKFAEEAYRRNVVANQAISMIARGIASTRILAYARLEDGTRHEVTGAHPLPLLLERPSALTGKAAFLESLVSYYLLSGNAYVQAVGALEQAPSELHLLRPDRVRIVPGRRGMPAKYCYRVDDRDTEFSVDPVHGTSCILHIRHFHPLSDWYGMAPVEAAAFSIDQHNQAAAWNQALLQNGARPSGALVVGVSEHGGRLSEDQYWRLKQQIDEQFSGASNAGRPLLLEGGLEWKEMSITPRDMDFLGTKHSSARDIALAFGVPPQLLGIPGDNTYSNLAEARLALWEQTILPLAARILEELARWLNPMFGSAVELEVDMDAIPALAPRREKLWQQVQEADFLTAEEKRDMLGFASQTVE